MKILILLALIALAAADDKYVLENIDLSDPSTSLKTLRTYLDCTIDKGPCNEVFQSYKVVIPEAVRQACGKCTVEQKRFGNKLFELMKTNFYEDYVLFKQMYDPENKYFDILENELSKYKTV